MTEYKKEGPELITAVAKARDTAVELEKLTGGVYAWGVDEKAEGIYDDVRDIRISLSELLERVTTKNSPIKTKARELREKADELLTQAKELENEL